MYLNVKIGPYEITRRTEYSKPRLLDATTKDDITKENEEILEKIISDYEKQIKNPDEYFEIEDNCLCGLKNSDARNIKYLFIPNNITSIKKGVCAYCQFEYISLPESLKEIRQEAFCGCLNLKYIEIPQSVKEIGKGVFDGCSDLEEIKLSNIKTLEENLFSSCWKLKEISLPDSVETIENYAFYDCNSLKNIKLSKNLTYIGTGCFYKCKKLQEINLPQDIHIFPQELFKYCESLKEFYIPDSIEQLNDSVFETAKKIKNINIPKGLNRIVNYPFARSEITTLTFNYDLKELDCINVDMEDGPKSNLLHDSPIEKLIISSNVKTITPDAFGCDGSQVKTIDYKGTEEEFKEFKRKNKKLFKVLSNIKEINFIEDKTFNKENIKDIIIER